MMYSKLMVYQRLYREIVAILVCGGMLLLTCGCTAALSGASALARDANARAEDTENRPIRLVLPEASGTVVFSGEGVTIDASNTSLGYFMVKSEENESRLKLRVTCGDAAYTYDLADDGVYETFPCQMGSGTYLLRVMENVEDDLYAQLYAQEIEVVIDDPTSPFLFPSQYVSFDASSSLVAKSYLLVDGLTEDADMAAAIYRFVVRNTSYDYDKAATVQSGYLPDPDETLSSGKGICFDYSALLAAMLRAQGIPAQLVIGTVMPENISHAWNRVWLGGEWIWMDATFDGTDHRETDYTEERVY